MRRHPVRSICPLFVLLASDVQGCAGDPDYDIARISKRLDGQIIHKGFTLNSHRNVLPQAFSAFQHLLLEGCQYSGLFWRYKIGVGLANDRFRLESGVGVINPGVAKLQVLIE